MKEIAIYGKGGIGKSTISANLSAALASRGKRVMQIGCDPKHDSTRLLLGGKRITTVLDYLRVTKPLDQRIEDILIKGYRDIMCVEAGGPKPGVGCAGRGIITAFEMLDRYNVKDDFDIIVYDVLGDVVCGGFAVPIRSEYADTILIVTSGEYMALYAANNILRGIQNYDYGRNRVAGIVYNRRNVKGEDERVAAFAKAVGLPICTVIPRSDDFAEGERNNKTVVESGAPTSGLFYDIADMLLEVDALYAAQPLTDEELEYTVFGSELTAADSTPHLAATTDTAVESAIDSTTACSTICAANAAAINTMNIPTPDPNMTDRNMLDCILDDDGDLDRDSDLAPNPDSDGDLDRSPDSDDDRDLNGDRDLDGDHGYNLDKNRNIRYLSLDVVRDEPLHGCAFNGAISMSVHLRDAVILAHSPKSCVYLSYQTINSSGRRALFERGALMPVSISPNFESTYMTQSDMVFGGMDKLLEKVTDIKRDKPKAIVVVSSCPSGIIGDDVERAATLTDDNTQVIVLKTDGNLTGDYLQGMLTCYTTLAEEIIDKNTPVKPNTVNIVFEKVVSKNTDANFKVITGLLDKIGVSVNCRFLCQTDYDSLKHFTSAPLNLLAYNDYTGVMLKEFFESKYGCTFLSEGFPVGFGETELWLEKVASFFGRSSAVNGIISAHKEEYNRQIARLRPELCGRTLMIITYNKDIDWVLQAAYDAGIDIVLIGILKYSQDSGFRTKLDLDGSLDLNVIDDYDGENVRADIEKYKPDILLTNYASSLGNSVLIDDTIPMCPDVGFFSGLNMITRWATLLKMNMKGEWSRDEGLFNKHYT